MCDHDNSSIVALNGTSKGSQRFTVKVVSRLVQNENVRLVPHSSCEHDLHLLSSRKGRHTVVSSEFSSKTTSSQVLLDVLGGKRADVKTGALRDLHIDGLHGLVPTHFLQNLGAEVLSAVHGRSGVLDLVLKVLALVGFPSSNKLGNNLLYLGNLSSLVISERDLIRGLLKLQLGLSELQSDLDKRLLILTLVGVTPTDVLIGSLVQVLLNVVESVLSDVSDTGIGVLPHISNLRLDLSDQKLDHGRLSGTVLTNTGNTRAQTDLNGDIEQSRLFVTGVGKGAATHLHEGLTLGLNTLDRTRLGEIELELTLLERKVSTSTRLDLDELIQVTLEGIELQVLNLQDVGTAIV
mmetsp:Transcript_3700/g.5375  ORF Transcript_3700/g.5375 Transcript_3700/m.5375 type:complete len:351 (-) Transcript_3700:1910-2962(-)